MEQIENSFCFGIVHEVENFIPIVHETGNFSTLLILFIENNLFLSFSNNMMYFRLKILLFFIL